MPQASSLVAYLRTAIVLLLVLIAFGAVAVDDGLPGSEPWANMALGEMPSDFLGGGYGNYFNDNGSSQTRTHNSVHELTAINSTSLAYDLKGNLTTNSNGQTHTWDFENCMKTAVVGADTATYQYDAFRRRVKKSFQGNSTIFAYDGWRSIAEYDGGASPSSASRVFVFGTYLDEPLMMLVGSTKYYYHANDLYSVAALTNSAGTVVERYKYDPYGKCSVLDASGTAKSDPNNSEYGNPFTYTGQRLDKETGLMYYKNRYYSTVLGRFVSRDLIGYEGSENLYEYVRSKPNGHVDPIGLLDRCTVYLFLGHNSWVLKKVGDAANVDPCARVLGIACAGEKGDEDINVSIEKKFGDDDEKKGVVPKKRPKLPPYVQRINKPEGAGVAIDKAVSNYQHSASSADVNIGGIVFPRPEDVSEEEWGKMEGWQQYRKVMYEMYMAGIHAMTDLCQCECNCKEVTYIVEIQKDQSAITVEEFVEDIQGYMPGTDHTRTINIVSHIYSRVRTVEKNIATYKIKCPQKE